LAFRSQPYRGPIAAEAFRTETLEAIDRLAVDALMWPEDEDAINVKVAQATHEPPLPFAGEGSAERETVMTFMIGSAGKKHDR
jgi:hypothetical protein